MKKDSLWKRLKNQRTYQLMVLPGILFIAIFNYIPMAGILMAFQDYDYKLGYFGSKFVGLKHFQEAFSDSFFIDAFQNSLGMSLVKLLLTFPMPIIFALIINEITNMRLKKWIQTASYLPHFISWVVAATLFQMWLDPTGLINVVLEQLGLISEPVAFLQSPELFWVLMAVLDIWKEVGWLAILYISAMASIPVEQYEAATVDGANRLKKIWYITLPSIKGTLSIVFILSMGSLFAGGMSGSNFNQSLLLSNVLNRSASLILDTYVVELGLSLGRFSFATAVGLILSVLSCLLFLSSNWIVSKIDGEGNSLI